MDLSLPIEVWCRIIDFLRIGRTDHVEPYSGRWTDDMNHRYLYLDYTSISRVCKTLQHLVRPALHQDVYLGSRETSAILLHGSLRHAQPALGAYTKSLHYATHSPDSKIPSFLLSCIVELMPNLTALTARSDQCVGLERHSCWMKLKKLTIDNTKLPEKHASIDPPPSLEELYLLGRVTFLLEAGWATKRLPAVTYLGLEVLKVRWLPRVPFETGGLLPRMPNLLTVHISGDKSRPNSQWDLLYTIMSRDLPDTLRSLRFDARCDGFPKGEQSVPSMLQRFQLLEYLLYKGAVTDIDIPSAEERDPTARPILSRKLRKIDIEITHEIWLPSSACQGFHWLANILDDLAIEGTFPYLEECPKLAITSSSANGYRSGYPDGVDKELLDTMEQRSVQAAKVLASRHPPLVSTIDGCSPRGGIQFLPLRAGHL